MQMFAVLPLPMAHSHKSRKYVKCRKYYGLSANLFFVNGFDSNIENSFWDTVKSSNESPKRKDGAMLSSQTSAKASFIYTVIVYLGI